MKISNQCGSYLLEYALFVGAVLLAAGAAVSSLLTYFGNYFQGFSD